MDSKMLMKLMEKKKEGAKSLDPEYKDAKMGVLKALHDDMGQMMGDDVRGLKKVTVASPDKTGLEAGLDKAKALLGAKGDDESAEPEMDDEASEGEEDKDPEEMTPEELQAKIQELQDVLKAKMKV